MEKISKRLTAGMITQGKDISLLLSAETIQAQCLFAMGQARNTSYALATMIALQTFVTSTTQPSDRDTHAHRAIMQIIKGHAADLHSQLLAEQAEAQIRAMRAKDSAAITRIHNEISRNGFHQAALLAIRGLDAAERTVAKEWVQSWYRNAKSRALAASGYPDALNFHKAGISPLEYAAMSDLNNYLVNTPAE